MRVIYGSGIYDDAVTVSMLEKLWPGVPIYDKQEYLDLSSPPDDINVYSRDTIDQTRVWAPDTAKLIPIEQLVAEALK